MKRLFTLFLCPLVMLFGCAEEVPFNYGAYENDLGAAMIEHILGTVPAEKKTEATIWCILFGHDQLQPANPGFRARFPDEKTGVKLLSGETFQPRTFGRQTFIVDRETDLTPLQVHIGRVESFADKTHRIEAGWAYKRELVRHVYRVSGGGSSPYQIEQLEALPDPFEKKDDAPDEG